MKEPTSTAAVPTSDDRRVLFWGPDSDESHVQESVEHAARFLDVPTDAVLAAIRSGDLLGGWFVDWEGAGGA
jgi:hypothetical protein